MTSVPLDPAPPRPRARALECPSCGAGIELHAQGWAVSVVCGSCGSVLDATNDTLRILQRHSDGIAVLPRIFRAVRLSVPSACVGAEKSTGSLPSMCSRDG